MCFAPYYRALLSVSMALLSVSMALLSVSRALLSVYRALLSVSRALLSQSDVRDMDSTCVFCGVPVIVWYLKCRSYLCGLF